MSPKTKPLSRVNEEAIQLLTKELGVADTARFIRQFTTGTGDYTEERRERFAETSLDDLLEEIEERRGRNS
ncbi:MAG: hypothetical protein V5A58_04340 [Salinibacter sp.]|uniref:hypothetical protein n=1 Tax=Salinibacter sp. TaxID=2065818 RepID=UPI002FC37B87